MGAKMESAIIHLKSIKCDISRLKSNILKISSKMEYQMNALVSHKKSFPKYESFYEGHVHSFDVFFNDVNQLIFSANSKIAHLEMETNFLTLILEENHVLPNTKFEFVAEKSFKEEQEKNDSSFVTEKKKISALERDEYVAEEKKPDSSDKKSKTSKKIKSQCPRESVTGETSSKINYESFDEAGTELDMCDDSDSIIDEDRSKSTETKDLNWQGMGTIENIDNGIISQNEPENLKCKKFGAKYKKRRKLQCPHESVNVEMPSKINYESFEDKAATTLKIFNDSSSTIDSGKSQFTETKELNSQNMSTSENINLTSKNIDNAKVVCQNDPENFQCKKCSAKYLKLSILHMHIIEKHSMTYFQMFKCEICSIKYSEIEALCEHKKVEHEKQYPFDCSQCEQRFRDQISLNSHLDNVHRSIDSEKDSSKALENKYKCNLCNKVYVSQHSLHRHNRAHTEEFFECPICKREYKDPSELRRHYFLHIEKKMKCPYCNKKQKTKRLLRSHMSNEHGFNFRSQFIKSAENISHNKRQSPIKEEQSTDFEKMSDSDESDEPYDLEILKSAQETNNMCHSQLKCQFCSNKFSTVSQYLHHRKTHDSCQFSEISPSEDKILFSNFEVERIVVESDETLKHVCKICNKFFRAKSKAEHHLLTHIGDRPYECEICKMRFRDVSYLKKHAQKHSNSAIKGKSTKVKRVSANKSNKKVKEKEFACMVCSKKFKWARELTEHIRVHTGEKPYLCTECGKCYANNSNLKCHMLIHTGVKPHQCQLCPWKFYTAHHLKSHMNRTHLEVKTHACEYCGSCFRTRSLLKQHKRIHTDERPFKCGWCQKAFRTNKCLKEHTGMHTGVRYTCQVCSKSYARKSGLRSHSKNCIKVPVAIEPD